MAAARRHVFVEKVLKRLFPCDPHGQEKKAPPPAAPETPPEKARCRRVPPAAGAGTEVLPGRRLYTVALPPEGYVPAPAPRPPGGDTGSESGSSSSEDAGDQDLRDQPKRRIRKHKSKKKLKNLNSVHGEQAELRKQTLLAEELQPEHTDGPPISKNKKRKLKKKQQMRRKRAAGLLPRATGVSFLYAPSEGGCEHSDGSEGAGAREDAGDAGDGEADTGAQEKADGILDFLKSTQEMYFYDGASLDPGPAFLGAAEELFTCLRAGSLSPSDMRALEHLKALLPRHDPERLQRALQAFAEHCAMPPDQASVVSALFRYWATHMLPGGSCSGDRGGGLRTAGGSASHSEDGAPGTVSMPHAAPGQDASALSVIPAPAREDEVG